MPQMGLENRGRAVGLVNSGTPKEKVRVIFLNNFIMFNHFYAHTGTLYMHKIISLILVA